MWFWVYGHFTTLMDDEKFEVVIHHGGHFVNEGGVKYVNGQLSVLSCDEDRWSYFEVLSILREMGYINVKDLCYSVGGCAVLEERLQHFIDDVGALHMVGIAKRHGSVHMFVIHSVCEAEVVHMLEYFPAGENAIVPEIVPDQVEPEVGEVEVDVQCDGAEQVQPESGEVEGEVHVEGEAEVHVHVEGEAEVHEVDNEFQNETHSEGVQEQNAEEVQVEDEDSDGLIDVDIDCDPGVGGRLLHSPMSCLL